MKILRKIRKLLFNVWCLMPFGYLLRFDYGDTINGRQRITLNKNLWIIVDDGETVDALPMYLVSQKLLDECERRLINKYGLEPIEKIK